MINDHNILENEDFSEVVTATIEENPYANSNVIVPGSKGYIDLNIDYTDVTVPFTYELTLNPNSETPLEDFRVLDYSIDETSFTYKDSKISNYIDPKTASSNIQTVRFNFEWFEGEGENFDDIEDTNFAQLYDSFKYNINVSFTQFSDVMIGEAINAEKYGDEVIGYECANAESQKEAGCWRLFYQNKDYTYLISDNLIYLEGGTLIELYTKAGYDSCTNADVGSIGQTLNPMLKETGAFSTEKIQRNMRAVAYFTDPEQWAKYKNEDSIFAIGGPTLELFLESFNATSKSENRGITIEVSATPDGYAAYDETQTEKFKSEYNYGIYRTNGAKMWYLASPWDMPSKGDMYVVNNEKGSFWRCSVNVGSESGYKIRPIVCIKTSVFKEKYEATLESNYIGEAINADKYGEEVLGYECDDPEAQKEAGAWRLFYQNKYYTYLISDNKIALSDTLENVYTSAGYGDKTGADVSKVGQALNPMLKEAGGFTTNNTNQNIKAVGYLTDTKQWLKYENKYSIFAIGTPSIELFIESFNVAAEKTGDSRRKLEVSASSTGYTLEFLRNKDDFKTEYNYGIYRKSNSSTFWWTASPTRGLW